jgi:putative Holliday junction resolvase
MRYLAIDYGAERTGVAICDPSETVTSPLAVIRGKKGLLNRIADMVRAENVGAIVLGLPLNMDGSQGPQVALVRKFADRLKRHVDVPVCFQDERLSTFGAEDKLISAGFSQEQTRKRVDAVAAAEILDAFLEGKRQK